MSTTMDQIHHIRDMYYQQDKNISQIASETGLNRKTVSKYVDMEDFNTPSPTPASEEEHESKLDPFKPLIDEWLEADKLAPRKQRHTAKRIYRRVAPTRKTGGSTDGYKPLMLGQRLKALAFALLQPLCF